MKENPYSPPEATQVDAHHTKSLSCTVMFWLSCLVCLGMLGIAANGSLQYLVYTSQMGIPLPSSLLRESVWVGFGGIVMLYSAIKWRRKLIPSAAVSGACSLMVFFLGPLLA